MLVLVLMLVLSSMLMLALGLKLPPFRRRPRAVVVIREITPRRRGDSARSRGRRRRRNAISFRLYHLLDVSYTL